MLPFLILIFSVYPLFIISFYFFSGCSPYNIDLKNIFLPPFVDFDFPFGTNEFGQNLACMIGKGMLNSLKVSSFASFVSFALGTALGLISGYFGGIRDLLISRLIDFFQGFPSLVFVIFIVAIFGGGDDKIILSLTVFGWTSFARIARVEAMRLKESDFILSARVIGLSSTMIILKYVLPFVVPAVFTQLFFSFSAFILAEGGLGFLGLRPAKSLSLGAIISDEMDYIMTYPRLVIFPGLALTSLVVIFNLLGQYIMKNKRRNRSL